MKWGDGRAVWQCMACTASELGHVGRGLDRALLLVFALDLAAGAGCRHLPVGCARNVYDGMVFQDQGV